MDAALRTALGDLSGPPLIGVINSIGVRRDTQATQQLVKLTASEDEAVTAAAISSLGAIASPDAVDAIQHALDNNEPLRVLAADACLTAADRLPGGRKECGGCKYLFGNSASRSAFLHQCCLAFRPNPFGHRRCESTDDAVPFIRRQRSVSYRTRVGT